MGEKKWTFFTNFFTEKLEMLNQCFRPISWMNLMKTIRETERICSQISVELTLNLTQTLLERWVNFRYFFGGEDILSKFAKFQN
jgi:hypothetical protein